MERSAHCGRDSVPPAGKVAACLAMLALAALAHAQTPTTVKPPTTATPSPTVPPPSTLPPPGGSLQPVVSVNPQVLIGRWIHTRQDAETKTSDNVVIEFLADGSYTAKNRHSLLPTPEKPGRGRYSVGNIQGNTFDLRIERSLDDPDTDREEAIEIQKITVVNHDTLLAADGSTVRRHKE